MSETRDQPLPHPTPPPVPHPTPIAVSFSLSLLVTRSSKQAPAMAFISTLEPPPDCKINWMYKNISSLAQKSKAFTFTGFFLEIMSAFYQRLLFSLHYTILYLWLKAGSVLLSITSILFTGENNEWSISSV